MAATSYGVNSCPGKLLHIIFHLFETEMANTIFSFK